MAELKCTKCESKLTFGGASRSVRAAMAVKDMLAMVAEQAGWRRVGTGWECADHGR